MPMSVCVFVTLQNLRFFKSMLVGEFFLSAFCLRTMYRPQYWSDRSDFVPADVFWSKDHGKYFLVKIGLVIFFFCHGNQSLNDER